MSNKPTHIAYAVTQPKRPGQGDLARSRRGVALQNGNGFDFIVHDQFSVSGRLVCIENRPRERSATKSV
jgi:hypothetical protein